MTSSEFPIAQRSELGYQRDHVEHFLDRARASYEQRLPAGSEVTSTEIRKTAFPVKRRGYSARYVDAAMDRLEEVFYERERRARIEAVGEEKWWAEVQSLLSEVRGRLQRTRGKRFRRRGILSSGYRRSEVDAFLDRITDLLAGRSALSVGDVRNVVFHTQWRGYDEDQVDALLDSVVELLLATRQR